MVFSLLQGENYPQTLPWAFEHKVDLNRGSSLIPKPSGKQYIYNMYYPGPDERNGIHPWRFCHSQEPHEALIDCVLGTKMGNFGVCGSSGQM